VPSPGFISRSCWRRARSLFLLLGWLGGTASVARATIRFDAPLLAQLSSAASEEWFPTTISVADLNGDGVLDVVSPAPFESLLVLLGNGDGTLATPLFVHAHESAGHNAVADFDGDGHADIVRIGWLECDVHFGDGTGRAWTRVRVPVDYGIGIAVGDFDGDGRQDLVVPALGSDAIVSTHAFLARPGRTFERVASPQESLTGWWSTEVVDLNRDGKTDIVAIQRNGDDAVLFLEGRGDGTFVTHRVDDGNIGDTYGLDVGDVTCDGLLDVVVARKWNLTVHPGMGDGTFGAAQSLDTRIRVFRDVALDDIDRDGIIDLVESYDHTGTIGVRMGAGNGALEPLREIRVAHGLSALVIADLDRDERPDLLGMATDGQGVFVARGDGEGGFGARTTDVPVPRGGIRIAQGDLDRDDCPDIVVSGHGWNPIPGGITVLLGRPDRAFLAVPGPTIPGSEGEAYVHDLDEDGSPDVLVLMDYNRVALLRGLGDGSLVYNADLPLGQGTQEVAIGDATGDGHVDIVYPVGMAARIVPGVGDGTFGTPIDVATGYSVSRVAIADLNGDPLPDLAMTLFQPVGNFNNWMTAVGTGAGGFALSALSPAGSYGEIIVGDVDADGRNDLMTAWFEDSFLLMGGRLGVRRQHPDGSFAPMVTRAWPSVLTEGIQLVDLDGDGASDILYPTGEEVGVAIGNGSGGFALEGAYGGRGEHMPIERIADILAADFDRDGRVDLALANYPNNATEVSVCFGRDPVTPTVAILGPTSETPLTIGHETIIRWEASDNVGIATVDLFVSRHGPLGPYRPIDLGLANQGTHVWTVNGPASDSVSFKVVARDHAGNVAVAISEGLGGITGTVAVNDAGSPSRLEVRSVAPNPARGTLVVEFDRPGRDRVVLDLYDLQGRAVACLLDDVRPAGRSRVEWSVTQAGLRSGLYFLRLASGGQQRVARVTVIE